MGPYARLRPGTELADDVWIGNFVEVKNASLGSGTRAAHLSFIGDAQVGRNVNIGCGFITCNSSGKPLKQRTVIEDGVFIGSASQAIAPVTLGAGSFIATGTSVTDDVPPYTIAVGNPAKVIRRWDFDRKEWVRVTEEEAERLREELRARYRNGTR